MRRAIEALQQISQYALHQCQIRNGSMSIIDTKIAERRLCVLLSQLSNVIQINRTNAAYHSSIQATTGKRSIFVIGGAILDVQATPTSGHPERGTSVPGIVREAAGGVGRNITDGLGRLLIQSQDATIGFATIIGSDPSAAFLLESIKSSNIDRKDVMLSHQCRTPTICAVLDRNGEVAACVADATGAEQLMTPAWVSSLRERVTKANVLVLEANLTADSLAAACQMAAADGVPVFLEPVSVSKSKRCVHSLQHVTYISPNAAELCSIADALLEHHGEPALPACVPLELEAADGVTQVRHLAQHCRVVLNQGVKFIVLTLGARGAALISRETLPTNNGESLPPSALQSMGLRVIHLAAPPAKVVSLIGAGDTLVAGMVAALVRGADPVTALAYGMAAAKVCVECRDNVPQHREIDALGSMVTSIMATCSSQLI